MAAKRKAETEESTESIQADESAGVLTVSQFETLSDDQKQAFRARNGTVTNDPT